MQVHGTKNCDHEKAPGHQYGMGDGPEFLHEIAEMSKKQSEF